MCGVHASHNWYQVPVHNACVSLLGIFVFPYSLPHTVEFTLLQLICWCEA